MSYASESRSLYVDGARAEHELCSFSLDVALGRDPNDSGVVPLARSSDAWWVQEFVRLRQQLLTRVRWRLYSGTDEAGDVYSTAFLQLTQLLSNERPDWPASWFGYEAPPVEDVARFRLLAERIVQHRLYDVLRKRYRNHFDALVPLSELHISEHPSTEQTEGQVEAALDARRLILAVQKALDSMPPNDRAVLLDSFSEDTSHSWPWGSRRPRTDAERKRLQRLREQLRKQLLPLRLKDWREND